MSSLVSLLSLVSLVVGTTKLKGMGREGFELLQQGGYYTTLGSYCNSRVRDIEPVAAPQKCPAVGGNAAAVALPKRCGDDMD